MLLIFCKIYLKGSTQFLCIPDAHQHVTVDMKLYSVSEAIKCMWTVVYATAWLYICMLHGK